MGFFKKWMDKLFGSQQESFANKTLDTLKKVKSKAQDMKGNFKMPESGVTLAGKKDGKGGKSVRKKTEKKKTEKVRARDAKGKFVGDDPDTPENEAWKKEFPTRE